MLSRFHTILERDGQTDRQTDGRTDGRTVRQSTVVLANPVYLRGIVGLRAMIALCLSVVQEGLMVFYRNGSELRNGSSWPSLGTLCGCAFGAISVLTLGALLTHR